MMKYDYLIIGSGLYGATFAYLARQAGKQCLVLERRKHLGGNVYQEKREGIDVHVYGPHIFHTSNEEVWRFANQLVHFNRFTLMTVANSQGKLYNLPFNMNTFYQMWGIKSPEEALNLIEEQRNEVKNRMLEEHVTAPRNLEEQAKLLVGTDVYEKLIKGYTEKQWGRKCANLPAFIIKRLPVRYTFDNNYFNDLYQGIPTEGYNTLIDKMLEGVECKCGVDFLSRNEGLPNRYNWREFANKLVFTGQIDDYYDGCFGSLQYRSLRFETEVKECANHQGVAIMNYCDHDVPYTRIIEHKHFTDFGDKVYENPHTIITREYPVEWTHGMEAYYPINDEENNRQFLKYKQLAEQDSDIIFGGRLAEYKYYDMAPTILSAIERFQRENAL